MTGLQSSDYSAMIEMWGICTLCQRSVFDSSDTQRNYIVHRSCGCLTHADEKCPFPKVNQSHKETSHATIHLPGFFETVESGIVSGFVRKTFPFETVESAFTKYLSNKSPYLKNIMHKADLESAHLQEIATLKSQLNEAVEKADEATNKLTVMTEKVEEMRKEWKELKNQDVEGVSKTKIMTSFDHSPAIGSDEHVLELEWNNFKQKFSKVHRTVAIMLQNSFDTRNSSLINSTVKKVDSATAVTNEARNSVVEVLKRETGKLNKLSISNDVVESGNKDDVKLLD